MRAHRRSRAHAAPLILLAAGLLISASAPGPAAAGPPRLTAAEWAAVQQSNALLTSRSARLYIFGDGFESGDTGAWSATFP